LRNEECLNEQTTSNNVVVLCDEPFLSFVLSMHASIHFYNVFCHSFYSSCIRFFYYLLPSILYTIHFFWISHIHATCCLFPNVHTHTLPIFILPLLNYLASNHTVLTVCTLFLLILFVVGSLRSHHAHYIYVHPFLAIFYL